MAAPSPSWPCPTAGVLPQRSRAVTGTREHVCTHVCVCVHVCAVRAEVSMGRSLLQGCRGGCPFSDPADVLGAGRGREAAVPTRQGLDSRPHV